jgi:hypothetical protein
MMPALWHADLIGESPAANPGDRIRDVVATDRWGREWYVTSVLVTDVGGTCVGPRRATAVNVGEFWTTTDKSHPLYRPGVSGATSDVISGPINGGASWTARRVARSTEVRANAYRMPPVTDITVAFDVPPDFPVRFAIDGGRATVTTASGAVLSGTVAVDAELTGERRLVVRLEDGRCFSVVAPADAPHEPPHVVEGTPGE